MGPSALDDNTFCELKGCEREHSRVSALTSVGEKTFCWLYQDGRSARTEVRTGVDDGEWIEVTGLQRPPTPGVADRWTSFDGKEQVILGDLSLLADGGPVTLPKSTEATKVASHAAASGRHPAAAHPGGHAAATH